MVIENKYAVGCLVQFYEIEMLPEYIDSCIGMMEDVENKENVTFTFRFSLQEFLEKIDRQIISRDELISKFKNEMRRLRDSGIELTYEIRYSPPFENIAAYRRQLNDKHCDTSDYVLWGETDSLWPKETFFVIEQISKFAPPKHIISFGYRRNWDSSWNPTIHPLFSNVEYQENDEWILNNEASEKAYMTLERMYEINSLSESYDIDYIHAPKADGSCLVISSELIRSGVNIPHSIILCGEDESFLRMAKLVMGDNFIQYIVKNLLRVHNRRHPKKRMYVLNEQNPRGFCDSRKGQWWIDLEHASKHNLENITSQKKSIRVEL